MNDWDLIQDYGDNRSEAAFATLMERHVNLVYSVALRQVRQPELAQEVTQAVFLLLAKKGPNLSRDIVLPGWLFRCTRFIAAKALRAAVRRQRRELEGGSMIAENQQPSELLRNVGGGERSRVKISSVARL